MQRRWVAVRRSSPMAQSVVRVAQDDYSMPVDLQGMERTSWDEKRWPPSQASAPVIPPKRQWRSQRPLHDAGSAISGIRASYNKRATVGLCTLLDGALAALRAAVPLHLSSDDAHDLNSFPGVGRSPAAGTRLRSSPSLKIVATL